MTEQTEIRSKARIAFETAYEDAMAGVTLYNVEEKRREAMLKGAQAALEANVPEGAKVYAYPGRNGIRMGVLLGSAVKRGYNAPILHED